MAHNLKPILLIDDKSNGEKRGYSFENNLPNELRELVDFRVDMDGLIKKSDEWSIQFLDFEPDKYKCIFLHHSYKDAILNPSQLSDLRDKLRNLDLIIFSGGKESNISTGEISRDSLFDNLSMALDAYLKTYEFPTAYLFGAKNRFYPVLNKMQDVLEEDGKSSLLNSQEFKMYMSILGYNIEKVKQNYLNNFSEEQIADKINEWSLNSEQ